MFETRSWGWIDERASEEPCQHARLGWMGVGSKWWGAPSEKSYCYSLEGYLGARGILLGGRPKEAFPLNIDCHNKNNTPWPDTIRYIQKRFFFSQDVGVSFYRLLSHTPHWPDLEEPAKWWKRMWRRSWEMGSVGSPGKVFLCLRGGR